jgi:hypothetical protein
MTREEILDLAKRVEALDGPNFAIEVEIENALGLAVFVRDPKVGYGDADYDRRAPKPYTASLDAAMQLVPDGWSLSFGELRGIGVWRAWLNDHNTPDGKAVRHIDVDASTPALALTAVALCAIAESMEP